MMDLGEKEKWLGRYGMYDFKYSYKYAYQHDSSVVTIIWRAVAPNGTLGNKVLDVSKRTENEAVIAMYQKIKDTLFRMCQ